jgi:hypothetical protein
MNRKKLTKQLKNVLTEDEEIENIFPLEGCNVCATNKRLIELKGNTTRDYDYTHISSIAYSSRRYWLLIVLGVIIIIAATYFGSEIGQTPVIVSVATGFLLIVVGIIHKPERVEIHVIGVGKVEYKGKRTTLNSLVKLLNIVRQKHFANKKETD